MLCWQTHISEPLENTLEQACLYVIDTDCQAESNDNEEGSSQLILEVINSYGESKINQSIGIATSYVLCSYVLCNRKDCRCYDQFSDNPQSKRRVNME